MKLLFDFISHHIEIRDKTYRLIPFKYISGIYFVYNIVQTRIIAVGNDGFALGLELIKVVNDLTSEERFTIGNRGFVDDYLGTFGLDALHDTLDGALAEVIAVGLHGEAVDTNYLTIKFFVPLRKLA